MQRVDIDEIDFAQIQSEMVEATAFPGDIAIVIGRHPQHGLVMLVQAGGLCVAMGEDALTLIPQNSRCADGTTN